MVGVLVSLGVLCMPHDSFAIWGWIEQLSGPGPFRPAIQLPFDRLLCVVSDGTSRTVQSVAASDTDAAAACAKDDPTRVKAFVSLEVPFATSAENVLFPNESRLGTHQVTLYAFRPVFFFRALPSVDVGAGIGWNHFSGDDFQAFSRVSIPLRARIIPAGLFSRESTRGRAIYLSLQADLFPQQFTNVDFGSPVRWTADHDFVASVFLGIDLLRVFRGR